MDAVGWRNILPTIVDKLAEVGCGQREWTEWARKQTQPDPTAVEENVAGAKARDLEEHNILSSIKGKVRDERRRKTDKYWDKITEISSLISDIEDMVKEKIEGEGEDIMDRPNFDDRRRPPKNTLKERVAKQPLQPYEEYWDPETKQAQPRIPAKKAQERTRRPNRKTTGRHKRQVSDRMKERIEDILDQVRDLLDEVHTRSRVR